MLKLTLWLELNAEFCIWFKQWISVCSFIILFQSTRPRSQVVVVFFPLNRTLSSKSASIVSRQERLMPRKRRQIQNGMMISLCKSNNSSCSDTYRAWSKRKKTKCILFHFMVIEIGYDVLNFTLKSDMF